MDVWALNRVITPLLVSLNKMSTYFVIGVVNRLLL